MPVKQWPSLSKEFPVACESGLRNVQYAYVLCAKGTVEAKTPDKEMRFRNGRRHGTKVNIAAKRCANLGA